MTLAQDVFSQIIIRNNEIHIAWKLRHFNWYTCFTKEAHFNTIKLSLQRFKYDTKLCLIDFILKLCDTTAGYAEIHLPEDFLAVRRYGNLTIQKKEPLEGLASPEKQVISTAKWLDNTDKW